MESITLIPSNLLEYLYCPRFTYYEFVLQIPQREEKRYKVKKGKDFHKYKENTNKSYLRKKLGVVDKESEVELNCPNLHIRGKVDEVLFLNDGSMAPFDYKWSEYKKRIWKSTKVQETLYALMIKEIYQKPVNKAFLCFIRDNNKIVELKLKKKDFTFAKKSIQQCLEIIQTGYYPEATKYKTRCTDCTYQNLCIG